MTQRPYITKTTTKPNAKTTSAKKSNKDKDLLENLPSSITTIVLVLHVLSAIIICSPLFVYGYARTLAWMGDTSWTQEGSDFNNTMHIALMVALIGPCLWVVSGLIAAITLTVQRHKITEIIIGFLQCTFLGPIFVVMIIGQISSDL